MIDGERPEFEAKLAVLFAGIDKPLGEAQREAFWRGLQRMSLVEFNRCVDLMLRELEESDGAPRHFSVGQVWQAKHRLRAPAPQYLHQLKLGEWDGDNWDVRANVRLLQHITRRLAVDPRCYGSPQPVGFSGPAQFGKFGDNVAHLVRAKNAWAADMRDVDDHSGKPIERAMQDRCWTDLIGLAEQKIARAA